MTRGCHNLPAGEPSLTPVGVPSVSQHQGCRARCRARRGRRRAPRWPSCTAPAARSGAQARRVRSGTAPCRSPRRRSRRRRRRRCDSGIGVLRIQKWPRRRLVADEDHPVGAAEVGDAHQAAASAARPSPPPTGTARNLAVGAGDLGGLGGEPVGHDARRRGAPARSPSSSAVAAVVAVPGGATRRGVVVAQRETGSAPQRQAGHAAIDCESCVVAASLRRTALDPADGTQPVGTSRSTRSSTGASRAAPTIPTRSPAGAPASGNGRRRGAPAQVVPVAADARLDDVGRQLVPAAVEGVELLRRRHAPAVGRQPRAEDVRDEPQLLRLADRARRRRDSVPTLVAARISSGWASHTCSWLSRPRRYSLITCWRARRWSIWPRPLDAPRNAPTDRLIGRPGWARLVARSFVDPPAGVRTHHTGGVSASEPR